eukprot:CAMPEP_0180104180 /NCGR_PEP_ID=MMETSP0985-20121206/31260_1 /TAXON_ID=483367 /ORGANISM="non described non described, Strain CCMP 2436" /LENGTH=220 /DNA_ID=CAMNT_0022040897 /DNA_START=309 /DNA_END=969 /DNA_ORIENTATION=+
MAKIRKESSGLCDRDNSAGRAWLSKGAAAARGWAGARCTPPPVHEQEREVLADRIARAGEVALVRLLDAPPVSRAGRVAAAAVALPRHRSVKCPAHERGHYARVRGRRVLFREHAVGRAGGGRADGHAQAPDRLQQGPEGACELVAVHDRAERVELGPQPLRVRLPRSASRLDASDRARGVREPGVEMLRLPRVRPAGDLARAHPDVGQRGEDQQEDRRA